MDADDPNRVGQKIPKYVVVLQNHSPHFTWKARLSAVLTTSNLRNKDSDWRVVVPAGAVPWWRDETVILCEDVYSFLIDEDLRAGDSEYLGRLPDPVMRAVDVALTTSLFLA